MEFNNIIIDDSSSGSIHTGTAIDIGTTTVQAQLIDLDTGKIIDTFSALNEQRIFGTDVISRISAAQSGKLNDLFSVINKQTENILIYFLKKQNIPIIEKCAVSGNTTMLHFFCRADPAPMGTAPYTPAFLEERYFSGDELSLSADQIITLPGISAFVGADITAGLAFINIMNKGHDALFVDIGTNGEMALWKENEKHLLCCSTAAGPCFEEIEFSCGLSAVDFINAVALMREESIIDETGALSEEFLQTGFPVRRFSAAASLNERAADIHTEKNIITQKDIRRFQLAKSAVYSGIKSLCQAASVKPENLGSAFIAGGLGFLLNLKSAAVTGLLPAEIIDKANVCGNTSLLGAAKSLTDLSFLPLCREIVSCSSTIELAHNKYFAAAFTHNMWFK